MSEPISVEEFRKMMANGQINKKGRLQVGALPAPKANKFGAVPQEDPDGGPNFRSTLEAKHAAEYSLLVKAGEIMSFGKQPKVLLGAGITWLLDFIVHHNDGTVEYVDSKGKDTPDFKLKEKLFREKYPNVRLTIRRASDKKGKK